jgi:hypothetical protein
MDKNPEKRAETRQKTAFRKQVNRHLLHKEPSFRLFT